MANTTHHVPTRFPRPASIRDLIKSHRLRTHFQPILSARQRTIIGVEGLVRSPLTSTRVISPDRLFRMAAAEGVTASLEHSCCKNAIETFASLIGRRSDLVLFLNLGSWMIQRSDASVEHLKRLVQSSGLSPDKIAVEILEARIDDVGQLQRLVRWLREGGFLLALDDVGAGHSNLDRIPLIKPDVLKVDRSLITHIGSDFHKQETLKSLVGLSRRIGALVVAEGIETEEEAIVALELGADLLQGFFLGYPSEDGGVSGPAHPDLSGDVESLARNYKRYMIEKINNRKLHHRRFNVVLNEVLCHLANAEVDSFCDILQNAIRQHPSVECIYVLDEAGIQITETVWNPDVARRRGSVMFHPAPKGTDHSLKEYYYILLDVELQKYTTDPYVSLASGNISRTISTHFRDASSGKLYILCIDVLSM